MAAKDFWVPALIGAGTAAVVGVLVWRYASSQLAKQLDAGAASLQQNLGQGSTELNRQFSAGQQRITEMVGQAVRNEVGPTVDRQIRATLSTYGLTPQNTRAVATQVDRILRWVG